MGTPVNTALGKTGQGPVIAPTRPVPFGGGLNAFPTPAKALDLGGAANNGYPIVRRFIPPLALFNDASQWVNRRFFVRPFNLGQNPNSLPLLRAQYFTPPPQATSGLAAGNMNVQLQLGAIVNQAAQLSAQASNFYG